MEKTKKKMRTRNKVIIIISIVVAVLLAVAVGIFLYIRSTPEWALKEIYSDIKSDGVDGLRKHSTENFNAKIDKIEAYAKEKGIGTDDGGDETAPDDDDVSLKDYLKGHAEEYLGAKLLARIKDIDWGLEDIKHGRKETDVVVSFKYSSTFSGEFDVILIKDGGTWKIDDVDLSKCIKSAFKSLISLFG